MKRVLITGWLEFDEEETNLERAVDDLYESGNLQAIIITEENELSVGGQLNIHGQDTMKILNAEPDEWYPDSLRGEDGHVLTDG